MSLDGKAVNVNAQSECMLEPGSMLDGHLELRCVSVVGEATNQKSADVQDKRRNGQWERNLPRSQDMKISENSWPRSQRDKPDVAAAIGCVAHASHLLVANKQDDLIPASLDG